MPSTERFGSPEDLPAPPTKKGQKIPQRFGDPGDVSADQPTTASPATSSPSGLSRFLPSFLTGPSVGQQLVTERQRESEALQRAHQQPGRITAGSLIAAGQAGPQPFLGFGVGNIGAPVVPTRLAAGPARQAEKAGELISKSFVKGERGGDLSAADVKTRMETARQAGQPLTLLDVGGTAVKRLGGTAFRSSGEAGSLMRAFQEGRTTAINETTLNTVQGQRLADRVAQDIASGSARQSAAELATQRSQNARPLWDKAMEHAPVWSLRLQEFLDHPDVQAGLRQGWRLEKRNALAEGRPANPSDYAIVDFNEAGDPVFGKVPNMKLLQLAKEGLDDMLGQRGMRDDFGRPTKAWISINNVRRAYLDELDKLNPDYRAARQQWSSDTESMESLRDGRDALTRKVTPEELGERWAKLSDNDKAFYKLGIADKLMEDLDFARMRGFESRALIKSPATLKKLRTIFDSTDALNNFTHFIENERSIYDTGTHVMGGSQTAERFESDAQLAPYLHAGHAVGHAAQGNVLGALASGARALRDFATPRRPGRGLEVAKKLIDPNVPLDVQGGRLLVGEQARAGPQRWRDIPKHLVTPSAAPGSLLPLIDPAFQIIASGQLSRMNEQNRP